MNPLPRSPMFTLINSQLSHFFYFQNMGDFFIVHSGQTQVQIGVEGCKHFISGMQKLGYRVEV